MEESSAGAVRRDGVAPDETSGPGPGLRCREVSPVHDETEGGGIHQSAERSGRPHGGDGGAPAVRDRG